MVAIQICSNREWAATKEIFIPTNINRSPYGEYFSKEIQGIECVFYQSGATKTMSAGACQYAIDHWNLDLIIVLGTCGGVSNNIKKLDIILADKSAQYDIKPLNKMDSFFSAVVEIDNSWINIEDIGLPLIEGFVATADQSVTSSSSQILSEQEVLAADWETAAIARICSINGVRCCVLRGVSDLAFGIDGSDELQLEDYRQNTVIIMNKLITEYLPRILSQVKNKL